MFGGERNCIRHLCEAMDILGIQHRRQNERVGIAAPSAVIVGVEHVVANFHACPQKPGKQERVLLPRSQLITFAAPLWQKTESIHGLGGKHEFASPRSRSGGEFKGRSFSSFLLVWRPKLRFRYGGFSHPNRVGFTCIWYS